MISIPRCFTTTCVIDDAPTGLAFEDEGERCAGLLAKTPQATVMVMRNYGVLVIGQSVIRRLIGCFTLSGQPLRLIPDEIAEQVAGDLDDYPGQAECHFVAMKTMLDAEGADYAQ